MCHYLYVREMVKSDGNKSCKKSKWAQRPDDYTVHRPLVAVDSYINLWVGGFNPQLLLSICGGGGAPSPFVCYWMRGRWKALNQCVPFTVCSLVQSISGRLWLFSNTALGCACVRKSLQIDCENNAVRLKFVLDTVNVRPLRCWFSDPTYTATGSPNSLPANTQTRQACSR